MTGHEIQKHYEDSGYAWSETSHHAEDDFTIIQDHGLGEGRRGIVGEVVSVTDGRIEVNLSFYDESTSHGDEWHKTVVDTPDEIVAICGRAIEDGARPPKAMLKAA